MKVDEIWIIDGNYRFALDRRTNFLLCHNEITFPPSDLYQPTNQPKMYKWQFTNDISKGGDAY
jgi:hypothetical protein